MFSLFRKYALIIPVLLFLMLLILVWLFPSYGSVITILFLFCGFVLASFPVVESHRQAYLQDKISRGVYVRTVFLHITGILLAFILASVLGRYIAEIATRQISHDLIRLITGIMVGLLIGLAVGIFVKQAWGRLVKLSPETE
jgi:hypothetical protein